MSSIRRAMEELERRVCEPLGLKLVDILRWTTATASSAPSHSSSWTSSASAPRVRCCTLPCVRSFLCDWADTHRDTAFDDDGEETVMSLAAQAALVWPRPVAAFDASGAAVPGPNRFASLLSRMRGGEWADDFWVSALAPAALRFQITVLSSEGAAYDRLPQALPAWADAHGQTRHLVLGHLVVGGEPLHYVAAQPADPIGACTAKLYKAAAHAVAASSAAATSAPADERARALQQDDGAPREAVCTAKRRWIGGGSGTATLPWRQTKKRSCADHALEQLRGDCDLIATI